MVVQSIALPQASGGPRDQELATVPASSAVAAAATVGDRGNRSLYAPVLVSLLVATQVVWLAVLGYGVFRFLL